MKSQHQKTDRRIGFTLTELMLVIAIMAVLSTMSLALMRSAQEDAKYSATRSRIHKIEAMLQLELENYEVRRLPIRLAELASFMPGANLAEIRDVKRRILADLISSEMPRPFVNEFGEFVVNPDLGRFPTQSQPLVPWVAGSPQEAAYKIGFYEWLFNKYGKSLGLRLRELRSAGTQSWDAYRDVEFDLPGEYLYAILERIDYDGSSGIEALGNAAIGNSDGDQYPEVVDAWGNSMQLRILQVISEEVDASGNFQADTGVWQDYPTDWTTEQDAGVPTDGLPVGYCPLNPVVPQELNEIRFHVVSPQLDSY